MSKKDTGKKSMAARIRSAIRRRMNDFRYKMIISKKADRMIAEMEEGVRKARSMSEEEHRKLSEELRKREADLKESDSEVYKSYRRRLRSKYLKDVIPSVYAEAAKNPVEEKVVFMENGTFPAPTVDLLYAELLRQGKYSIKTFSLMIRKVSDAEYFMNAVDYIREAATAKAVFITTANRLMSQFDLRPETRLIQLWHGVGMFKKVGFSTLDSEGFGRSAKSREVYNDYRNYTDVTVAAEEQIWTFEDAFHISRDTGIFKPIGISRTDVFFDEEYRKERRRRLDEAFPECKGKKIILYAPTFRGRVAQATAPDELDIKKMAEKLSDDYVLLIRHHEVSKVFPKIPAEVESSFAFDMNRNNIMSTDGLLSIADILITDYSSLGFEFAVMEKPMVFFAYDLEEYLDTRGMYYDYSEITPGPVCKTTEEVADYIADIDNRFDRNAVREFREKYVGACDGHATERTIALIEQ